MTCHGDDRVHVQIRERRSGLIETTANDQTMHRRLHTCLRTAYRRRRAPAFA